MVLIIIMMTKRQWQGQYYDNFGDSADAGAHDHKDKSNDGDDGSYNNNDHKISSFITWLNTSDSDDDLSDNPDSNAPDHKDNFSDGDVSSYNYSYHELLSLVSTKTKLSNVKTAFNSLI